MLLQYLAANSLLVVILAAALKTRLGWDSPNRRFESTVLPENKIRYYPFIIIADIFQISIYVSWVTYIILLFLKVK